MQPSSRTHAMPTCRKWKAASVGVGEGRDSLVPLVERHAALQPHACDANLQEMESSECVGWRKRPCFSGPETCSPPAACTQCQSAGNDGRSR
eukprot:1160189-Pelagomonas_calceolata.AAC.4